jgi:hypothetical protein
MPGACGATVKANLNDEAAKFRLALLALIPRLNQSLLSENSSGVESSFRQTPQSETRLNDKGIIGQT